MTLENLGDRQPDELIDSIIPEGRLNLARLRAVNKRLIDAAGTGELAGLGKTMSELANVSADMDANLQRGLGYLKGQGIIIKGLGTEHEEE